MKKVALSLMAIAITFGSIAQKNNKHADHKPRMEKHEKHEDHDGGMDHEGGRGKEFKKLDLTDAQKSQMKVLQEDFRNQMKDLKNNTGLTREQLQERRKALALAHQQKVQAILTPEQRRQLES